MNWLNNQRIRYTLKHHRISHDVWEKVTHEARIFHGLSAVGRAHLRELTTLFLRRKSLVGVQGLTLSTEMAVSVAAQASLLILNLGLEYFDGWIEVVIYPGAFRVARDNVDATGVISHQARYLSGESWARGPVILSWEDVAADLAAARPGRNVVVHEFAHKLDVLNGRANGMPPLHPDTALRRWTEVFSIAFEHLQRRLSHHRPAGIDAYGATSPAEFFAVASECFFTDPQTLHQHYPAIYDQLALFYRQTPLTRLDDSAVEELSQDH